jgi:phage FluMu protein Com
MSRLLQPVKRTFIDTRTWGEGGDCIAAVKTYFLKQECPRYKLIPNGTKIKIPNNSKAPNQTYKQVQFLRIKD